MLIVESIRREKSTGEAIIYCKNTPVLYRARIPKFPANTVLEKTEDGEFVAVDYWGKSEEVKRKVLHAQSFWTLTKGFLSMSSYEDALERFGENCVSRFQTDPFFLLSVPFKEGPVKFPALDKQINIRTFEQRLIEIKEAAKYILEWNADHGNTWMNYTELETMVLRMLKKNRHPLTKDEGNLFTYLNFWKDTFYFDASNISRKSLITTREMYRDERQIYDILRAFSGANSPYANFHPEYNPRLSEKQNRAIKNLLVCGGHFSILTGGPGTGKTTILKCLTDEFEKQYSNDAIQLVSPTGKAAKRVREVLKNPALNVSTIHKFLGYDAEGHRSPTHLNSDTKLTIEKTKLLIIDEASMTDLRIFKDLLSLINLKDMKIILVGDTDQLPSVGAGDLLRDMINMGIYTEKLTESFRFIGTIADNADKINHNDTSLNTDDTFIIKTVPKDFLMAEIAATDADLFITPYRKDSAFCSTTDINRIVQQKVNGQSQRAGETGFRIGDTVIFNRTNYTCKYFNGEMGTLTDFNPISGEYTLSVDGKEIKTFAGNDIDLGYAITIHKSQGSEYDHVCVVLPEFNNFVTKKMLYTAITRAKKKITVITTEGTLDQVICNNADLNRKTILKVLIAQDKKGPLVSNK